MSIKDGQKISCLRVGSGSSAPDAADDGEAPDSGDDGEDTFSGPPSARRKTGDKAKKKVCDKDRLGSKRQATRTTIVTPQLNVAGASHPQFGVRSIQASFVLPYPTLTPACDAARVCVALSVCCFPLPPPRAI